MRMAVSGTHCSGKTALVDELSRALPTCEVVDEPYFLLEEEGRQFAEVPTLADFELQAHRSAESIVRSGRDSLFERCPVDFLAYLLAHRESKHFHVAAWLPRLRDAVERLDLIVFVPVEHPGRILVPSAELPALGDVWMRSSRSSYFENPWEFQGSVLEVTGTSGERARRVLAHLGNTAG